jgi:hypothetical protein
MNQTEEMRQLREEGETLQAIGDRYGMSRVAVHYRLNGRNGQPINPPLRKAPPPPANDNKVVHMVPYNGGCSTTSGRVPVSLARIPTIDGLPQEQVAA